MNILSNGVASSVMSTKCVNVSVSDVNKPKTSWVCKVKGKVWVNESGLIIENNSYVTNDLPIRQFFIFSNQLDYDVGKLSAEAKNLGTAKIIAESL
ncbi:hypothetical protein [Pseudoalteromonas phage XCL1123]|nr:hypothetical protein [Pseudoalteromonas phage XCL1123]